MNNKIKLTLNGTLSIQELEKLEPIGDVAFLCRSFGNNELADICEQLHNIILNHMETLEDYDCDTIYTDDPEIVASAYRSHLEGITNSAIEKIADSRITKGSFLGNYKILKNSFIPKPFPSLPLDLKRIYQTLINDGAIDENGFLTKDIELSSRYQAVGLSLGYYNANAYLF